MLQVLPALGGSMDVKVVSINRGYNKPLSVRLNRINDIRQLLVNGQLDEAKKQLKWWANETAFALECKPKGWFRK